MKVLLATDGSKYAEEAAWLLAHLPHSEKLELTVLFISNIPKLRGSIEAAEIQSRLELADKQKAALVMANLSNLFEGANATLDMVIEEGHVGTKIIGKAETQKSDLIVLGALGHSLFERMFGSTSDFVATHAKCSVLIVRPTGLRLAKRPIDVCVGFDSNDSSSTIFDQLSQFGWGANTKFEIASVVSMPFNFSDIPFENYIEEIVAIRKQELERAANLFREISPIVETHVIEANHIGDGLVQFAKKKRSDILVVGDTGGGLLSTFLLGSTSKYVLRNAECSVWIARPS